MSESSANPTRSIYRWAMAVAVTMFPLIFVGQLVTTHDAGMAVPDWPGTYGYNLFLYPWAAWLYGPFDLFVEHGHRLLGALVGVLAILLCVVAWYREPRRWVRVLCYLLLGAIIGQGALGGMRVLLDQRTTAMLHGCIGPLVFAFSAFVVIVSSRDWQQTTPVPMHGVWLPRLAALLWIGAIVQLFLGAQLRHALPDSKPTAFVAIVHLHLTMAGLLTLLVLWIAIHSRFRGYRNATGIHLPANTLLAILLAQVILGIATWVANYALPWPEINAWFANYTIHGKGVWESLIVNAHSAMGSLIIVASLWLTARLYRRKWNVAVDKRGQASSVSIPRTESSAIAKQGVMEPQVN